MTGFRARNRRTQAASNRRRSSGPRAHWKDELRVPKRSKAGAGIPILVLSAEYHNPIVDPDTNERDPKIPYFVYMQAKVALNGGKQIRTDCVPEWWPRPDDEHGFPADDPRVYDDRNNRKPNIFVHLKQGGDNRVGYSMRRCFTVLDLRQHVELQAVDRDGKPVFYNRGEKQGQPVMELVPMDELSKDDLQSLPDDARYVPCKRRYLDLGSGHTDQLLDLEQSVEHKCSSCQGGIIERTSFVCPECSETMMDWTFDNNGHPEVDYDAQEKIFSSGMKCPHCKRFVFPQETIECSDEDCETPVRSTLSDHVFWLRKTGDGKDSSISAYRSPREENHEWLTAFLLDGFNETPLAEDWKTEQTEEGVFKVSYTWSDPVAPLMTPFDFTKVRGVGIPSKTAKQVCDFVGVPLPDGFEDDEDRGSSGGDGGRRRGSDPRTRSRHAGGSRSRGDSDGGRRSSWSRRG